MTRRDYLTVTRALKDTYTYAVIESSPEAEIRTNGSMAVLLTAYDLADAFAKANPRFDREHFMAQVRGEKPLDSKSEKKQ